MQEKICEECKRWTDCEGRGYNKCKKWREMFCGRWRQLMTPDDVTRQEEQKEQQLKRKEAERKKHRTHLEDMLRDAAPWKYRREENNECETVSVAGA